MPPNIQESKQTWRQHWFVVNVLVELPIIGSFFKHENFATRLHEAGKCTAMLVGGTASMMHILVPTEEDSMSIKMVKMSSSMAIGMTTSKVAYNGMTFLYQCVISRDFNYHKVGDESNQQDPLAARIDCKL